MILAEGGRRGVVAQHDERRRKAMRATRFRRAVLFAERLGGIGKKVKGREIGPPISSRALPRLMPYALFRVCSRPNRRGNGVAVRV